MSVDTHTAREVAPFTGTSDPRLCVDEILDVIEADIAASPRTLQVELGPSEVGHTCPRRIAYKLLGYPEKEQAAAWLPYIGQAVHEQLACAFRAVNARLRAQSGHDRYLVEHPVTVVTPTGRTISGHLDLFDVALGQVVDFKIVGKTTIDKARRGKVDTTYRSQIGLYAEGLRRQGYTVARATVLFLPRNDVDLRRNQQWTAEFTADELEEGATRTLARFDNVADGVEQMGPAVLAELEPVDAACSYCPFFTPGSPTPLAGCAGPDALAARASTSSPAAGRQLDGLIA